MAVEKGSKCCMGNTLKKLFIVDLIFEVSWESHIFTGKLELQGLKKSGGGNGSMWEEGRGKYGQCGQGTAHLVKQAEFLWHMILVHEALHSCWVWVQDSVPSRAGGFCFCFLSCLSLSPTVFSKTLHSKPDLFVLWSTIWEMEHGEEKEERYAVKCLKYNLIWAKCSPQDPKNGTRGHLQPLITAGMTQIGCRSGWLESIHNTKPDVSFLMGNEEAVTLEMVGWRRYAFSSCQHGHVICFYLPNIVFGRLKVSQMIYML